MQRRTLRSVVYLGAGLGIISSIFTALETYYASLQAVCSINSFLSCGKVDSSGLTSTLGIPDYLWGIGGFVLIFLIAAIAEARPRDRRPEYLLLLVTTAGIGMAAYFLYVELALIGAFCIVCGTSYVMGLIAWGGTIALVRSPPDAGPRDRKGPSNRGKGEAKDG
jgi:uncharacterized membrane protein